MDSLNIKLASAEDKVVKYFVYTAVHTKPETKLTRDAVATTMQIKSCFYVSLIKERK
jgi:hypothetical protein